MKGACVTDIDTVENNDKLIVECSECDYFFTAGTELILQKRRTQHKRYVGAIDGEDRDDHVLTISSVTGGADDG